jgi:hypothetical protein
MTPHQVTNQQRAKLILTCSIQVTRPLHSSAHRVNVSLDGSIQSGASLLQSDLLSVNRLQSIACGNLGIKILLKSLKRGKLDRFVCFVGLAALGVPFKLILKPRSVSLKP